MTLDELRRLNPREIGSWPALPKLGALVALLILIMAGGYFLDWSNQWDEFNAAHAKEDSLRGQFLDKKRQAINLEAYRKQLADIEQSFGAMLKQLPNKLALMRYSPRSYLKESLRKLRNSNQRISIHENRILLPWLAMASTMRPR